MELLSFVNQKRKSNISIDLALNNQLKKDISKRKKSLYSEASKKEVNENPFEKIHNYLNQQSIKKFHFGPKSSKSFNEIRPSHLNQNGITQNFAPFIEPEFFARQLINQHATRIKVNQINYYSSTRKGLRNFGNLENQDVILIDTIATSYKLFAIFDGNGQYGKSIADLCASYFRSCLKTYEEQIKKQLYDDKIVNTVKICLKKTEIYLYNFKFNEIQYSGTTAIIVLISATNIFTFNIGNSRAVLGMGEQCQQNKNIYDFQISKDHDLKRLDQVFRIKSTGALIQPLKDQFGEFYGPDRIWNKNQNLPGTYITRTLGLKCGSKAGIISQPEVCVLRYTKRMKFLVLASDGLWFMEQNDEVIEYLSRYYYQGKLSIGLVVLMQQTVKRWKKSSQLMDDISIIVIVLSQEK